jgi:hypothetical protein
MFRHDHEITSDGANRMEVIERRSSNHLGAPCIAQHARTVSPLERLVKAFAELLLKRTPHLLWKLHVDLLPTFSLDLILPQTNFAQRLFALFCPFSKDRLRN